jgi:hypothetical protein
MIMPFVSGYNCQSSDVDKSQAENVHGREVGAHRPPQAIARFGSKLVLNEHFNFRRRRNKKTYN